MSSQAEIRLTHCLEFPFICTYLAICCGGSSDGEKKKLYLHVKRTLFGSFADLMLASTSEKEYMSLRYGVDIEEGASAFGLLAWRKSTMLCLIVLTLLTLSSDMYQVYYTSVMWNAMSEVSFLPTFHGISGFAPNEMFDDFVSDRTQLELNLTKPSDWTTYHSLFRLKPVALNGVDLLPNDLCLAFDSDPPKTADDDESVPPGSDENSVIGNDVLLANCNKYSQWVYGSEVFPVDNPNYGKFDQQILLRAPEYYTNDIAIDKSRVQGSDDICKGDVTVENTQQCRFSPKRVVKTSRLCVEAFLDRSIPDSPPKLRMNTCTGNKAQKFEISAEGYLRSILFRDKCASINKSSLSTSEYSRTALSDVNLPPSIVLKNCDYTSGNEWLILPFTGGVGYVDLKNIKEITSTETDIRVVSKEDTVKVYGNTKLLHSVEEKSKSPSDANVKVESCSFLSLPFSSSQWPTNIYQDRYEHCLFVTPSAPSSHSATSVTYDFSSGEYDRFQAIVGMTSAETLKNGVDFIVKVDDDVVATINCRPKTVGYSYNETIQITRNFCKYEECIDYFENCNKPYQPVDILLSSANHKLELITVAKPASTDPLDGSFALPSSALDGILYAAWGDPKLSNVQRSGEETVVQHTTRIIEQMKSTVTLPSLPWKLFMKIMLFLTDLLVLVCVSKGLKWWTTYRRSRQLLVMGWVISFLGPLAISCVPLRLTMDWQGGADEIGAGYAYDVEKRFGLRRYTNEMVDVCNLMLNGSVEEEVRMRRY